MDNLTVSEVFYPREATLLAAICAVLFSVVGILGNLATALALIRYSKLRKHATTAFVISLCISDLLFCLVNLPLTAFRYIHQAWLLGPTLCKLFPFFFYGNVAVSLLSMVAITINRYVLISRYGLYERLYTPLYIGLMIAFAWLFSFSIMAFPLLEIWGRLGLDPPTFSCTILVDSDGRSPKKFLFIFGFLLPCIVIIVAYTCIYWKVQRSRRTLHSHCPLGKSSVVEGCNPSVLHRRDDIRLTTLMLTIFCCFLACFLPLMLVNVADDQIRLPTLHVLASILAWASSVINPFIYAASNRQYRTAYQQLLCSMQINADGRSHKVTSGPRKPSSSSVPVTIAAPGASAQISNSHSLDTNKLNIPMTIYGMEKFTAVEEETKKQLT